MATILKSNSTAQPGSYDERVNNIAKMVLGITNSENKTKEAMTANITKYAIEFETPEAKFRDNRVSKAWPTFLKDVMDKIKKSKQKA